jgi:organic anion transporter 4A
MMAERNNNQNKSESTTTHELPETESIQYGWFTCRPSFLQSCLSPGWILTSCCLYVFIQQFIVAGTSNVVVTSIEKRFFLRSSQVGTVFSCFDIGNLFLTIVVSYFGYRHKPKWLGSGALVFALGCFVFVLPQFIADNYDPIVSKSTDLCKNISDPPSTKTFSNPTTTTHSNTTSSYFKDQDELSCKVSEWYFVFLLVAGQLIIGAGASPLFNLGPSYLNENVTQKNSGLVIGVFFSVAALGSGVGFILGGYFLAIYVDFEQVS